MNFLIPIIAGFLSGLIGSMGFGGGGVLIIYLVIFSNVPQITAQGINLIFFIPCAILATIIYAVKKQIQVKKIFPVIIGGIFGAILSNFFLKTIESILLSKVFAIFLIVMGITSLLNLKRVKNVS